jgi:hypothetical protein
MDWQAALTRKYNILEKNADANMLQATNQGQEASWKYAPGGLEERTAGLAAKTSLANQNIQFGPGGAQDRTNMMAATNKLDEKYGTTGPRPSWGGMIDNAGSPIISSSGFGARDKWDQKNITGGDLSSVMRGVGSSGGGESNWMARNSTTYLPGSQIDSALEEEDKYRKSIGGIR